MNHSLTMSASKVLAPLSIILLTVVSFLFAGCSKDDDAAMGQQQDSIPMKVVITFDFGDGDAHNAFTRASLTDLAMSDMWVFDYMDGELKQTIHQTSGEANFGRLSMSLDYGGHSLFFVASRGANPTVNTDSKTIVWGSVRDTFHAAIDMDVKPAQSLTKHVTLSRVVGRLRISATDVVPAEAARLMLQPSAWYYGLNYETGEAVASKSEPISVSIPAIYAGTKDLNASFYAISGGEAWQTDVMVSLTAADASVLGAVTLRGVPVQRNHITAFSGGIVGAGRTIDVGSDDEWVEDPPVTW